MPSDAERAIAMLRYANYAKVAEALLVSRAAVADWAKGRSVTPYRVNQLEQLLRPDLQIQEAAPPEWAERLQTDVDAIRLVVESEAIGLAALQAILAAIQSQLPPPDDDPADDPAPARPVARPSQ